ncbi:MAG: HesA/MoeB/ThiF family protein [Desulfobacteraceae bacterium]|nr:HesA/MoeB/ThiF family protein [Desulfobacteraceae bacterium]
MIDYKNKTPDEVISGLANEITAPWGRKINVLHESDAIEAAGGLKTGLRQIYMAALGSGIWPVRYMRNAQSISAQEQLKLAESCAAVIGAGGLGANVLMLLARMGIGGLNIADPDVFEESNLNRQLTATKHTMGMHKSKAAQNMINSVNPAVEIKTFQIRLTGENAADILSGADIAIDALDNISARLALADACRKAGIHLIHAAISGFEGQVMTLFPEDKGLEIIYGNNGKPSSRDPAASPEAVMGVPGPTPAIIAGFEVMEAVKILLGRGRILKNRMLYIDLENFDFQEFCFGPEKEPDQS